LKTSLVVGRVWVERSQGVPFTVRSTLSRGEDEFRTAPKTRRMSRRALPIVPIVRALRRCRRRATTRGNWRA